MRTLLFLFLVFSLPVFAQQYNLLIGTYTGSGSKGIYVYRFDAKTGTAKWVSNTDTASNPSYLALAPKGNYVYAVNETGGANPGSVSAYAFNKSTGALTFLNKQPTGGDAPCYIAVDKSGRWAVVANYSGGNRAALPIAEDGKLQPYAQLIQDTGSGGDKERQEHAHVHSTVFSPNQHFVFSPDLGTDKIMIYKFNAASQEPLTPAPQPFAKTEPGSGPRHFTFSPNQKYAYVIEELSGAVTAFKYSNGKLTFLQHISSHPANYSGSKGSADIHISPDGKFLYASNRGDANSIAVFSVGSNGKLQLKGVQPTLGIHPRNFMIDPTGQYVLVANRDSDAVVIFKRNPSTGLLRDTGNRIEVPKPVCLQMMK